MLLKDDEDSEFGVSQRDAELVKIIEEEGLSVFTFDGVRRITGTHPETLSRALDRLEEAGVVTRTPEGYSVSGGPKASPVLRPAGGGSRTVQVLHTYLPYDASEDRIVASLKGRWFDNIRWVGMAESEEGVVMKWVTDDGTAIIDARFSAGQLDIEAKVSSESDLPKAVRASHQLVGRISKLYASRRPGSRVALMQIGYFPSYAM